MCTNPHLPITSVYTHRVKVLIYITCTNISPVCIICMDKCHCLYACMCVCRYNNQLYYTTSSMNEPLSPAGTYTWPQLWPTYLRLLECTQSSIPTGQPDKFSHSTLQLSHTPLGVEIHVHIVMQYNIIIYVSARRGGEVYKWLSLANWVILLSIVSAHQTGRTREKDQPVKSLQ